MILSDIGKIVEKYWYQIPQHFLFVKFDEYIVMPNHIHGILVIEKTNGCKAVETQDLASLHIVKTNHNQFGPQSRNLASIIRGFKIGVKKWANNNIFQFAWQPRFYDHIIRNEKSLNNIRKYIIENPINWSEDRNNPDNPDII